ncbi:unnamed protein product [Penicillium salamii]|uniref:Glucose-methanol-choline oxidoreductase N-terminal domain-containing protein n=1 Tax=Penicillium salamii TaxID=1612424 RepID=A0A9W4IET9_9EURO|nr:unnamed protein product [Penicillium salamii]CAG7967013.1 unnamed protein product [Penicillium salamii]CAG7988388.1 unnamed protein product [Penicillium salamii]CAG8193017.1 unnamed protein product [Penicillium salamii]CAG8267217.1 unnamed protein product [Penicillium salamii]
MLVRHGLTSVSLLFVGIFVFLSEAQTHRGFKGRLAGDATFDFVVVGGGTAGLTIAIRLAEQQYQVAVVEAGGYYEYTYPLARVPAACSLGAGADVRTTTPIDWGFVAHGVPGADFRDIHYPRGKCLGGSPTAQSMERWAQLVNDSSYLFENVFPYFEKTVSFSTPVGTRFANATPLFNASAFSHDGNPVQVSYPKYATAFSTWVKQGMSEAGITEAQDFNSGNLLGHQYCTMTIQQTDATRSSSESAFLQTGFKSGSWTIYQFAMAKKVVFDSSRRATGVVVEQGNQFVLHATREVILAAGAFQSPQLLMVSGLGPAQLLQTHGISLIADLPGVGQNMWDHVFFGPSYRVNVPTLGMLDGNLSSLLAQAELWLLGGNGILTNPSTDYLAFEKLPRVSRSSFTRENEQELAWFPGDWPEVEVRSKFPGFRFSKHKMFNVRPSQYIAGSAYGGNFSDPYAQQPRTGHYATITAALVAPTSRGNITISSADTSDPPVINPNWLATDTDQRVAIAAYRRARGFFLTQSMAPVIIGQEYFPGFGYQTDTEILTVIKSTVMTIYHAACTCKMGVSTDAMAVVDSRARVFNVTGLRVVDASSFPILPPGHPQSTVYMLAEKIAFDIVSASRSG